MKLSSLIVALVLSPGLCASAADINIVPLPAEVKVTGKNTVKFDEKTKIKMKHNDKSGTSYLLFDPKNITAFECVKGMEGEKLVYIKERLLCMWGNEEIEEYVLLDDTQKDMFASLCNEQSATANKQDFVKAKVDDVIIQYTHKTGMISRFPYNVWFEYAGVI